MTNVPQPSEPRELKDHRTISINGLEVYIKPDDKYKGAVLDVSTGMVYLPREAENDN